MPIIDMTISSSINVKPRCDGGITAPETVRRQLCPAAERLLEAPAAVVQLQAVADFCLQGLFAPAQGHEAPVLRAQETVVATQAERSAA